jgi:putative tryptophan/tyrosine transport system substrate-binding protein
MLKRNLRKEKRQAAARIINRQVLVLKASTEHEIVDAFATLARERAGALLVGGDTFFTSQVTLLVVLTAHYSIPTIYPFKSYVDAGGLMSYGSSLLDAYRQTGVYAGRVLKGEKPADLPLLFWCLAPFSIHPAEVDLSAAGLRAG